MELGKRLYERQPNPEAALGAVERRSTWVKRSKMWGSISAEMPTPVSRTVMATHVPSLGGKPDAAPFLGVLGGVGQEVREDLLQPGRVGIERHRLRWTET